MSKPTDSAAQSPDSGSSTSRTPDESGEDILIEVDPPDASAAPAEPSAQERIAAAEAKAKESYDKYLRTAAELDNTRKRGRKDMEDARLDAQSRVLREVLPVLDNLERAVAHAAAGADGAGSVIEGVRLVLRQFAQALERCNVHQVEATGKPFDPNQHEAVSQVETADQPPGTVVEVLQNGYRIGERLLRPALVVVARAPAEPPPGSHGPNGGDPSA